MNGNMDVDSVQLQPHKKEKRNIPSFLSLLSCGNKHSTYKNITKNAISFAICSVSIFLLVNYSLYSCFLMQCSHLLSLDSSSSHLHPFLHSLFFFPFSFFMLHFHAFLLLAQPETFFLICSHAP